jgi:hypothetical protein
MVFLQIAFWRFDDTGAVLYYDAWIPNLQCIFDISEGVEFSNPTVQAGTVETLCGTIQERCVGVKQQYDRYAFRLQLYN